MHGIETGRLTGVRVQPLAMWWGPTILFLLVGMLLVGLGRPLGSALASGLQD